ncbi:protein of unknown function [Xenorhabdus bovienii]|uniref:Uncharacterized protein n=1 Tax=Xenorhabdus bovienii TaxID=40576 RepID=A0A0B6X7C0_XENBV|nr:protein of unknown function [Xenorhabdus bovienii]
MFAINNALYFMNMVSSWLYLKNQPELLQGVQTLLPQNVLHTTPVKKVKLDGVT